MLGIPILNHIKLRAHIGGTDVERRYTPISPHDTPGFFDVLVKIYTGEGEGQMSQHLANLDLGQSVEIAGPFGNASYLGNGTFKFGDSAKKFERVGIVTGGSGITSIFRLIQHIV